MNLQLWEVPAFLKNIEENGIDHDTGEILPEYQKYFNEVDKTVQEKCIESSNMVKMLDSQIDIAKNEIESISARVNSINKIKDGIKKLLTAVIPEGEKIKDDTGRLRIGWRKSESVVISDESALMEYCKKSLPDAVIEHDPTISKKVLKETLQGGIGINGAELVSKNNIQIK